MRQIYLTIAVAAVLLVLSACGGSELKQQPQPLAGSLSGLLPSLNSNNLTDVAGLPALDELPQLERSASNLPADFLRTGAETYAVDALANAAVDGDNLDMSPAYDPDGDPARFELSWGIYGFSIADYQRGNEIQASWKGTAPDSSAVFIGVSDYSSGRWQWSQGTEDGAVVFPDLADYFSGNGDLYVVVLLATQGEFSFERLRLGGNFPPVIDYTIDNDSGQGKLTVNIDADASTDPDGSFLLWEWSPEGGPLFMEIGAFMFWEYDHVGEYSCIVRASDLEGGMTEINIPISVTPVPGNDAPVADIFADVESGVLPLVVQLNAQNSTDPENGTISFRWDIDEDGYFEKFSYGNPVCTHPYITPGTKNPSVMVIDELGGFSTATMQIEVTGVEGTEPPVARLEAVYWYDGFNDPREFTAQGSTDPDNDIVMYEWDFEGDGTFDVESFEPTRNVIYGQDGGVFDVTVRVTDSGGRSDTAVCPVMVTPFSGQPETEPNDSPAEAISLGSFADECVRVRGFNGQLRFAEDEEDWYVIHAAHNGPLWLHLNFSHASMDMDFEMYSFSDLENPIFTGYSEDDNEFIDTVITAPGDYYMRVFTEQNGTPGDDAAYTLEFWDPARPVARLTASPREGTLEFDVTLDASASYSRYLDGLTYSFDTNGDGNFDSTPGGWLSTTSFSWEGPRELKVKVQDMLGSEAIATVTVTGF